jgi:FSR family fosmidomycin resistance protein-like MFS transporter
MARWTFAGSVGVVAGPIALGAVTTVGLRWRGLFLAFTGLTLIPLAAAYLVQPAGRQRALKDNGPGFRAGIAGAVQALRRVDVLRWLTLLQCADLMMDVLLGFLALYLVDVAGATPALAGIAVAVWTGVGLLGDLLLIPLLDRVQGLTYLRLSAAAELVLFPAFLLAPATWAKIVLLGMLGLFNAGWYSILKAQLYSAMPGQSGTVMAVGNAFGLVGGLIPLGLGLVAERFDLVVTMWLLMVGPITLLIGIPRTRTT